MFDRCYCINSTTMLQNNENVWSLFFDNIAIILLIHTRNMQFYKILVSGHGQLSYIVVQT